jgi:hypothetical protein
MAARSVGWLIVVWLVLPAASSSAQEKGQIGITMGYPASVGIVWQIAERVAVRPEISLSQSSVTTVSTLTVSFGNQTQTTQTQASSETTSVATGVSGLLSLWKRDSLSAYVTPRYAYTRGTASQVTPDSVLASDVVTTSHLVSGSFGAHYALGKRFGVFGEVGIAYTRVNLETPSFSGSPTLVPSASTRSTSTNRGVSTRSAAGVVLYFR